MLSLRSRLFRLVVKNLMSPKFNTVNTVQEQRKALEGFAKLSILPSKTNIQPIQIDKLASEFISVGDTPDDCVVLYLHGGAYNIGSLNTHRDLAARISKASKIKTLLVDYRLAPEHPHPAAVEDAVLAYRWLLKNGIPSNNIVIAGDSSGGGLAIAALVMLRESGDELPAAAVCLSPWTDLEGRGESIKTHINTDPFLTPEWLHLMAKNYISHTDPRMPLVSPIYADLNNLPPLLIQVGSEEILLSDSVRLAERARESGVDTTLDIWDNMWHVWHFFAGQMPEGNKAVIKVGQFIRLHLDRNMSKPVKKLESKLSGIEVT
jgi:epsilon-lactone hydrolase